MALAPLAERWPPRAGLVQYQILRVWRAGPGKQEIFMHYVFVESQGSPSADPLVLWQQGGPGSSPGSKRRAVGREGAGEGG